MNREQSHFEGTNAVRRPLQIVMPADAPAAVVTGGPSPLRTIGYIRVSSKDKARQQLSPQAQAQVIRDYCRLHNLGDPLMIPERESAATIRKRPELIRILEMCRAGQVAFVVVQDLTRLFRDVREALNTFDEMERHHGVRFLSAVDMGANEQTADGNFIRDLKLILGQRERKMIGERSSRVLRTTKIAPMSLAHISPAMAEKATTGKVLCGPAPFGFRWGPGEKGKRKLIFCSHDGPILRRVYQLRAEGVPVTRIAYRLLDENVRTKRGRRVSYPGVHQMLSHNWKFEDS